MRRSQINRILRTAEAVFARHGIRLPPFAHRRADHWPHTTPADQHIIACGLGWDVTDFGSGQFEQTGLTLVTLRNGRPDDPQAVKPYAEKVMLVLPRQLTPAHFHHRKIEDIIVRAGGRLVVRVWNANPDDTLADTRVTVLTDGVERQLPAGGELVLEPGESITLTPRLYHAFWGHPSDEPVVVGEVSSVNDDRTDNRFLEPLPRFPAVEEDEPAYRHLVSDYGKLPVAN
ncbi:MAG: D-lyxose/D-mannose family sugar isomerase [Tepidisphaerales bacterium]